MSYKLGGHAAPPLRLPPLLSSSSYVFSITCITIVITIIISNNNADKQ